MSEKPFALSLTKGVRHLFRRAGCWFAPGFDRLSPNG